MYKFASESLQRKHRVAAPLPTGGYIDAGADPLDIIPSAANMSLADVRAERARVRSEMVRAQAELAMAKAERDAQRVSALGQAIQVFGKRLTPLKAREHELIQKDRHQALCEALKRLLSEDQVRAIFVLQEAIVRGDA